MRSLIGWREWARTPISVDRSLVLHCQIQLSGIWIDLITVDIPNFGWNTQSWKQPDISWLSLPKKQLKTLVCFNKHLHRMGLTTNPVYASCQLEEETALHFLCVCPTFATLKTRISGQPIINASEFAEVSASAILQIASQNGRLETNLWHVNFCFYLFPQSLFLFCSFHLYFFITFTLFYSVLFFY
jgi:hypothetical protein